MSSYILGKKKSLVVDGCQDRALHFSNESLTGIVVADGAGSCKYSEQGAIAVVETIATMTPEQFNHFYDADNSAQLFERFIEEVIEQQVAKIEHSTKYDFSTTLVAVIVNDCRYMAVHVGDGVICQRKGGVVSVLSHPENGQYLNETYFVTMNPLKEHFRLTKGIIDEPIDFMVMSDGPSASLYVQQTEMMEAVNVTMLFEQLMSYSQQSVQQELDEFIQVLTKFTSDDCAIAMMVVDGVNEQLGKMVEYDDDDELIIQDSDDDLETIRDETDEYEYELLIDDTDDELEGNSVDDELEEDDDNEPTSLIEEADDELETMSANTDSVENEILENEGVAQPQSSDVAEKVTELELQPVLTLPASEQKGEPLQLSLPASNSSTKEPVEKAQATILQRNQAFMNQVLEKKKNKENKHKPFSKKRKSFK